MFDKKGKVIQAVLRCFAITITSLSKNFARVSLVVLDYLDMDGKNSTGQW